MKKLGMILIMVCCLFLTGCSNEFAKREYNANDKIAEKSDHYAKKVSVFNTIDGGYQLTVQEFDGRETMWTGNVSEDQDLEMEIALHLSSGYAKLVYIDPDGNVTSLAECIADGSDDAVTDENLTKTVALKSGNNRFKIVGYDCKGLELTMLFDEPKEENSKGQTAIERGMGNEYR